MRTFSERLRFARKLRDLTQKALAQASGISQSAIGSYESGQRQSSRALFELAFALRVSPVWLSSGKGAIEVKVPNSYHLSSFNDESKLVQEPIGFKKRPSSTDEWPFQNIPINRYTLLTTRDKWIVEKMIQVFIDACHIEYEIINR